MLNWFKQYERESGDEPFSKENALHSPFFEVSPRGHPRMPFREVSSVPNSLQEKVPFILKSDTKTCHLYG